MRVSNVVLCMFLATIPVGSALAANVDGPATLAKIDSVEFGFKDTVVTVKMVLIDSSGDHKERTAKIWQLADKRRMFKFLSPADVKGVAFLDTGGDNFHLYMPAFHKIRRIAGHIKNDTFMGTDFSYNDMSTSRLSKDWRATKAYTQGNSYVVHIKPKPGTSLDYGWAKILARKSDHHITRIEYHDKGGKLCKVATRKDFRKIGKYLQSYIIEMKDVKKNHRTLMEMQKVEFDTGVRDSFFSRRQLKRR